MFIETHIYDSPHQSGTFTKNELININNIIRIAPVIDSRGLQEEVFIHLMGCPNIPYVRSCESFDTISLKLQKASKIIK